MRTTAKEQGAQAFLDGDIFSKHNVITDGQAIYSYGEHFPMAIKVFPNRPGTAILVNEDRYSMTTSHHQSALRGVLAMAGYQPRDTTVEQDGFTFRYWSKHYEGGVRKTTMSEIIEQMAQKLVDARIADCAYGDCAELADLVPHGTEITYDTTAGIDATAEPNHWTRVTVTPTPEQWDQAVACADELWQGQMAYPYRRYGPNGYQ